MEALDTIERQLLERYNLSAPDSGSAFVALAAARAELTTDTVAALVGELRDRELFRWHGPIWAAVDALGVALATSEEPGDPAEGDPEATADGETVGFEPAASEEPGDPAEGQPRRRRKQ